MTALAVLGLVAAPLALAYAPTLRWIVETWWLPDSYYSHGPLVVLVAAVVLWQRHRRGTLAAAVPSAAGWLLLAPGLALHAAGALLTVDSLSAASLLLAVPGAVWLAGGRHTLRATASVLVLLLFALPMPMFATGRAVFELKEFAVRAAVVAAHAMGIEVTRVGAELLVPPNTEPLLVADPCSGLRSLLALTMLGYCVAFFVGSQRGWRRWLVLAAAVPIAVLTNVLRIVAICWLARGHGVAYATGGGHDLLNVAVWIVDLMLLLAVGRLARGRAGAAP